MTVVLLSRISKATHNGQCTKEAFTYEESLTSSLRPNIRNEGECVLTIEEIAAYVLAVVVVVDVSHVIDIKMDVANPLKLSSK